MRWSFTGGEHDWTRKTSAPRIDSPNRQYVSPFPNVSCSIGPRRVPRRSAIFPANSGFDVPEKTSGSRRDSSDRTDQRMSDVDELIAVEGSEGTLFAARTTAEIVAEAESHEPCLKVAEIEVCSRGKR